MTPAHPPHNRKFSLSAVSLTKARPNKHDMPAMKAASRAIEDILVRSNFLTVAPFSWVTLILRYGLKNEDAPHYEKINKRYGDLPLAIEVDTHELLRASLEQLVLKFKLTALKALIHAGRKYERPIEQLEAELAKLNAST